MDDFTNKQRQIIQDVEILKHEMQKIQFQIQSKNDSLNKIKQESQQIEHDIDRNQILVNKYFENMNNCRERAQKKADVIENYREKYWQDKKATWYEWDIKTLVTWLNYIIDNSDDVIGENIDYVSIEAAIKNSDFKKARLWAAITEDDLIEIGFDDDTILEILFDNIQSMCKDYPIPKRSRKGRKRSQNAMMSQNNLNDQKNSPDNYNHNVVAGGYGRKNPVIASDGNVYEREDIEKFLRENQRYPNQQEKIDVQAQIGLLQPDLSPPKKRQRRVQQ